MPSNPPSGRSPSSDKTTPPTSRRSARQQRLANREANRALAHASTRGGGRGGSGILLWTAISVVVGVVVIGAAFFISQSKPNTSVADITTPTVVTPADIASNGLTLGNPNAPVTIDLYGDYRCTGCYAFAVESGSEAKVVENYIKTGKAKLVWHDYLVIDANQGNTASLEAANAAWCAGDQGKYWTMHDWLYANQSPTEAAAAFSVDRLKAIGAKVPGLDTAKFNSCVDSGAHKAEIKAEVTPATVKSTPTIVVNGKMVADWQYETIAAAIDNPSGSPSPSATAAPTPTPTATPSASAAPSPSASTKP